MYGICLGASHGVGYHLRLRGVGHSKTSYILLSAVSQDNESVNAKQWRLKAVLWSEFEAERLLKNGELDRVADLRDMLDVMCRFLIVPQSLKNLNIGDDT